MSLQFYFGPEGSCKSRVLYEEMIRRSMESRKQNFLIIVPDQFTMQTQKELVTLHERGGIMNIDVLSFSRLNYRIMEELGVHEVPVLDDTGKSLVLQKVASNLKEQLPTLGGFLHRQGYIHEVKSAISEFMQYGIGVEEVSKLITCAKNRGALEHKLKDLETLYQGFLTYIHGNYVTTEETLEVLRRNLSKSNILKDSVVVFDGFTGFTPIQNRVIQEIMRVANETVITLTMGSGEDPYVLDGEQNLFHLSKKTVKDLSKLAEEVSVPRVEDRFIKEPLESKGDELTHLEKSLFRYTGKPFEGKTERIHIYETLTPSEEVHETGLMIRSLLSEGMAYRDIAVITGNLESYVSFVETEFREIGIPYFIDRTKGINLNPMIELIQSALEIYLQDFSYESVFHYLRSGMTNLNMDEVDLLENYIIKTGIRGYRRWSRLFTRKNKKEEQVEQLEVINDIRERFMSEIALFNTEKKRKAGDYVNLLYDYLVENHVQEKLLRFQQMFMQNGDLVREKEYAQIYRLVMDLLNQIYMLLGEEEISLREFSELLEAGFSEIEVGSIPQNVDRVLVGDMERTRLKQVKVLFFLGVNDGNIPKSASKGGIISDMDREFLRESEIELAPTPRQQMYIQRFYLYLNLTKPSKRLYLSYAKMNSEGKSILPAYLIDQIRKMYPTLSVEKPRNDSVLEKMITPKVGMRYLANDLREYVEGALLPEKETAFFTMYEAYGQKTLQQEGEAFAYERRREQLTDAAFIRYREKGISKAIARAIYGKELENSVTRLETFAACAYRHFLQYGLSLREREEFGFETVDMGNVYHAVLERFSEGLEKSDYTWFDFPEDFGRETVKTILESYAASYGDTILYHNARNAYAVDRMRRILTRTVFALQQQLKRGSFVPSQYEVSFRREDDLESVNVALSEEERLHLQGRIDRVDLMETDDKVYVKVIDYKSGVHQFDLAALYYGLQLQLVVYMNATMESEKKKHPDKEIVPAALLYYHIEDPMVESSVELSDEEINQEILKKLRMNGVVNAEPDLVEKIDHYMKDKSDIIPVEKKKDGSFSSKSSVMSHEELELISRYVNYKVKEIGSKILNGEIVVNPYEKGQRDSCTYCAYQKVCGFDKTIPGYQKRNLEELSKEDILNKMHDVE